MRLVSTLAVPADAFSSPDAIRRSVLLPQPEGPTTVTNSPRSTVRSTPESATVPFGNCMATSRKSRRVVPVCGAVAVLAGADRVIGSPSGGECGHEGRGGSGLRLDGRAADEAAGRDHAAVTRGEGDRLAEV